MAIAIISDIHANLEALREVFNYIDGHNVEKVYCLGDIVGYGPNPNECIELIRDRCEAVIMGNHDYAAGSEAHSPSSSVTSRRASPISSAMT